MIALMLVAAAMPPGTKLLDPISYRQVTVLPIVRTGAPAAGDYLTVEAAVEGGLAAVREHGDVNSVIVENRSGRTLLLVGGEMILGGQQDRILGQDTLVPPPRSATVAVYCVEHGRWSGAQQFGAAGGMVDSRVRARAKLAKDQQQVWNEVAHKTAQTGARTPTGTYRAVGEKVAEAIRPYREALVQQLDALPQAKDLVGLAAAVNGRIVSMDAFATPQLFMQYRDRILDAAIVGAQGVPEQRDAPKATAAEVERFLQAAPPSTVRGSAGEAVYESSVSTE